MHLATGPVVLNMPLVELPHCEAAPSSLAQQLAQAKLVTLDPWARDALIEVDSRHFSVAQSFVRQGLAYVPGQLDETIEDAVAERRGYWRCAPLTSLFSAANTTADPRALAAIALMESEYQEGVPWPWTINWRGKAMRYRTRGEAVRAARQLLAIGDELFDVGLMQVHWRYHKGRFTSLDAAFSPLINIRVADAILMREFQRSGDWLKAIARYHAPSNKQRGERYAHGVMQKLAKVNRESSSNSFRSQENPL